MLRKLALGGLRARFRDYAVLFSGLVIASAVFYMFLALATNDTFLKANSMVSGTPIIFMFGEVLLTIITLVYIVYANTFLMSMRQRDYAMFMMLGAKSGKIAQLIAIETVTVGVLASLVGVGIGTGITTVVGKLLMEQLHAPATGFAAFWPPAALWTIAFFIGLFFLAAVINARTLLKTPMLQLLHADSTPNRIRTKPWWFAAQAILAVVLLAIGYWALANFRTLAFTGLGLALVTIVLGTYFLFNSLLVWLINRLRRAPGFASKNLRTFTLAQLSFRIRDYTRILSVVAILFALALGAITVGLGFKHDVPILASYSNAYDVVAVAPTAADEALGEKLTGVTHKQTVTTKTVGDVVYFNAAELAKDPLQINMPTEKGRSTRTVTVTEANFTPSATGYWRQFNQFLRREDAKKTKKVVGASAFAALNGRTTQAVGWQVKSFDANYTTIEQLVMQNGKRDGMTDVLNQTDQKFGFYAPINSLWSGMAFMGFFLGLAFLAMLASTLMFKILSGAKDDQQRYLMLQKIGTRPSLLKRSIRQEIGALFAFPALVGVAHVLFGLQLFTSMLMAPYANLLLPFGLFLVLYAIYYLLTVWLYERLVITKDIARA